MYELSDATNNAFVIDSKYYTDYQVMWMRDASDEVIWKIGMSSTSYGGALGKELLSYNNSTYNPRYHFAEAILDLYDENDKRASIFCTPTKDVNGDGIVDNEDVVPIGTSTVPSFVYGVGASLRWKNFDFSFLFQGSGMVVFFIGGNSIQPFKGGSVGNILSVMTDPEDRWISSEISGTTDSENTDAMLPRLSYGGSSGQTNNFQNSTYWLRDGRYLRLKNLEFGYDFPKPFVDKLHAQNIRLGFLGTNLLLFSPFKWWDPEVGSSDGATYPISKTFSMNLTVNF